MAVGVVVVRVKEHILDIFGVNKFIFQKPKRALKIDHINHGTFHNFICKIRKGLAHFPSLFDTRVDCLAPGIGAPRLVSLLIPLLTGFVESPEIHGPAAHGTRGSGDAFKVPRLDASRTEGVPTAQVLEGPGLGVAYGTLHV